MAIRAGVSLMVCIGALASAASAHAQTTAIRFDSETGDYIGQGLDQTWTTADGTFTAERNYRNGIDVSFTAPGFSTWWRLNFGAANNVPLAPGAYEGATRFAFAAGNGLDVAGTGRGCNQLTGRFVVLEIALNPDNSVLRFAADFEQHCEDGTPGLFGVVRYNSTISSLDPFNGSYPSYQLTITPNANGRVTSSGIDCGGAMGASACTLTLPLADLVPVTAVPDAGYEFAGWGGVCSGGITAFVRVNQRKTCAAHFEPGLQGTTGFFFDSQPGDQTGQGQQQTFTPLNGTFQIQRNSRNGVSVSIVPPPPGFSTWTLEFAASAPLAVGSYPAARFISLTTQNGMYVRGPNGSCVTTLSGRFVVHEVVYRSDGSVRRFAADFEQRCDDQVPAMFGAIRYNSTIADLTPFGGQYPRYEIAMSVSGQGRVTGGGLDCASAGPTCTVSLASPTTALTLTATPDPGHVFVGWTDDCRGTAITTLNVYGPKVCSARFEPLASPSPRTLLFIDSQPGAVGNGRQFLYAPSNSQWTVSSSASQVTFSIDDGLDRWRVSFSVPSGQSLAPGYYGDAHRQPFTPLNGLDVSGPSTGCNTLTGRFVIHEVAFGANETVVRFAADFEQHCNDANAATFGSIRYNANTDEIVPFGGAYPVYQMTLTAPAHGRISGGGLDCGVGGPVCQRTLSSPETLSFTATADFGYVLLGWTGDCHGGPTVSINVNGPKSCAAVIEPITSSSPRSVFYADSRAADQLGNGTRQLFTPLSSRFRVSASSDRSAITTEIDDGVRRWRVEVGGPSGQPLTVGYYGVARASSPFNRFWVSADSTTCNGTGRFEILELAFGATAGEVARFAADVEHHCQDRAEALFVAIRYNAETDGVTPFGGAYPVYQLSLATPVNGTITGTGVNCSASASQCSVTLGAAAQVSLTAAPIFGYTFVGWTEDCVGGPVTTVHVNGPKRCSARFEPTAAVAPRTLLRWNSQANHYIGQGRSEVWSPVNSVWSNTAFSNASGVELRLSTITPTSYASWTLWFRAPTNEALQVGRRYAGADDFPAAGVAGLFVFGDGRACGGGEFTVREFVLANPTTVARFAADFVLDCGNASGPLLTGSVQYNSMIDVPVTTLSVEPASLRFASIHNGASVLSQPAPQTVRLTLARQNVGWTAVANQTWIQLIPASGTGSTVLTIAPNLLGGHPGTGSASGVVTVTLTDGTGTSRTVNLTVTLHQAGTTTPAIGVVDTPLENTTGVNGALPMTGWALDDLDITSLTICRAAVTGEVPIADANCGGASQIFLGTGTFVEGARPDVLAAFPTHPRADRAGWGFMLLTNMLPNQGNGTFVLYVYARDREGQASLLGTRTITCNNAQATLPFGAIDTPAQGETIAGAAYPNFGWVLTPRPKLIPIDGSTIVVYVDGIPIGSPSYNHFRPDVAALFPGLANTAGAIGLKVVDTTPLTNGLHTIVWTATDSAGVSQGIGSRYFRVANGASPSVTSAATVDPAVVDDAAVDRAPLDSSPIAGRRSWAPDAPWRTFTAGRSERIVVRGEEIDRFELALGERGGQAYAGYLRVAARLRPLPIGSRLDAATGVFTWSPGVGFVGTYDFVFVRSAGGVVAARREVRIVLQPKGSGHVGAQVVIDTPRSQQDLGQPFTLAGWAADLDAPAGTGIDTIHVWAYPLTGGAPIFLGAAALGGARPDVAAVHGERFREAGYSLTVHGLVPGHYDLAVFAWSNVSGGFVPAKVVRVTAR